MPTYQYACTACGHELEAVQSFTDDPLSECPACQGRLRKLFGSVGVVFKGPGFYRTDSRSHSNGAGSKSSDGAGKDSSEGKSSEGKGADSNGSGTKSSESSGSGSSGKSEGTSGGSKAKAAAAAGS